MIARNAVHTAANMTNAHYGSYDIARVIEAVCGKMVPIESVREVLEALLEDRADPAEVADLKEQIADAAKDSARDAAEIGTLETRIDTLETEVHELEDLEASLRAAVKKARAALADAQHHTKGKLEAAIAEAISFLDST